MTTTGPNYEAEVGRYLDASVEIERLTAALAAARAQITRMQERACNDAKCEYVRELHAEHTAMKSALAAARDYAEKVKAGEYCVEDCETAKSVRAELAAVRAENEMMLREYGPELRECRALLWAAYTAMASVAPEVTFHPDLMASIKKAAGRGEGEGEK